MVRPKSNPNADNEHQDEEIQESAVGFLIHAPVHRSFWGSCLLKIPFVITSAKPRLLARLYRRPHNKQRSSPE